MQRRLQHDSIIGNTNCLIRFLLKWGRPNATSPTNGYKFYSSRPRCPLLEFSNSPVLWAPACGWISSLQAIPLSKFAAVPQLGSWKRLLTRRRAVDDASATATGGDAGGGGGQLQASRQAGPHVPQVQGALEGPHADPVHPAALHQAVAVAVMMVVVAVAGAVAAAPSPARQQLRSLGA